ncbi:hypothetical protein QJQ45_010439 [Haematococcus lacustris]|nr:hypothetical protein QJQ45_010439 [Haematococcus lacustris]
MVSAAATAVELWKAFVRRLEVAVCSEQHLKLFKPQGMWVIGVGTDPGVTQAVIAAWDKRSGQLVADQLARWKLTKGQVKHASGLNNSCHDTEHLAAASSAGTSLEANLKHISVTLATWDAVWEVYLDPSWARRQRLRLYGAQDRALNQFFKKLEEDMAEVSMERHGRAKQLVVFFGVAGIGTRGAVVLMQCCGPAGGVITRFRDDSAADVIYATAPTVPTAPAAVPVLFQLNRRCAFGDAWGVCGSSPSLGSWDLTKAVPLKWTPGDLWCGLTFLPDTSPVEFKFVLLDARNGYKPKGWANDVSGPANLRMDVRRSGCLLTRGQAQAYAATPELSTELALPVKEFLSSSLAASPYTSDIPDTHAGLLSIEPGADAVDATFTLPGLDPIELAVSQVSASPHVDVHTPPSLTTEDVLPSAVDITPAAFHQAQLSGPDTEAIPADAPLYFEPTISDTPSTPAVREEVGSSQDPSIYKALEDQVAQRHALDGDRGAVLPTPPPDGNTSGPGTDVVPEPEACAGVTDASTQSEVHGEHVVMPEFVEDSTINSITDVLTQAASALQDVVGEPAEEGAEAGVEQEQVPNAHEAPTPGVSAVTGSSGISPRNSPIVMAASLVAHGILPSPVQLEQRVVQAGGQSLAPRNRTPRPFSSRGRISPVNISSAVAARLYQDMFGTSSLSISHRSPALSTAMPASAIDAASANMDIHEVPEEVESGLESSLAAVPEQDAGDAAEVGITLADPALPASVPYTTPAAPTASPPTHPSPAHPYVLGPGNPDVQRLNQLWGFVAQHAVKQPASTVPSPSLSVTAHSVGKVMLASGQ